LHSYLVSSSTCSCICRYFEISWRKIFKVQKVMGKKPPKNWTKTVKITGIEFLTKLEFCHNSFNNKPKYSNLSHIIHINAIRVFYNFQRFPTICGQITELWNFRFRVWKLNKSLRMNEDEYLLNFEKNLKWEVTFSFLQPFEVYKFAKIRHTCNLYLGKLSYTILLFKLESRTKFAIFIENLRKYPPSSF